MYTSATITIQKSTLATKTASNSIKNPNISQPTLIKLQTARKTTFHLAHPII